MEASLLKPSRLCNSLNPNATQPALWATMLVAFSNTRVDVYRPVGGLSWFIDQSVGHQLKPQDLSV